MRQIQAALADCDKAQRASHEAGEKFTANREVADTLREVDDAAETVHAAAQEAARAGIESQRAAYLAWAAGQAAAACARGPRCVENGFAVNGFRTGKTAVPWRAWLTRSATESAILPRLCSRKGLSIRRHQHQFALGCLRCRTKCSPRVLFCRGQ